MSTGRRWADLAQLRAREVGGAFAAVWLGNSAKRRLREALTQRRRRGWLRWLADCARACLGRAPAPQRPRANQRVLQRIPLTGAKEFLPFLREAWARARRCSWSTDFHVELRGLRAAAAEAPTHIPVRRPRQRARRRDFEQDLPEVRGIAPARRRNPGGSNTRFSRHRGRAHPAEARH